MTDIVIDRLQLRGAGTARLARIAARSLPAALDRALGDLADAEVPALRVSLDAEVMLLDDEAIAAVWADGIRAALLADGLAITRRDSNDAGRAAARTLLAETSQAPSAGALRLRVDAWAHAAAPRGPVPAGAVALAALVPDPAVAGGVAKSRDVALAARVRAALLEELSLRERAVRFPSVDGWAAASAPVSAAEYEPPERGAERGDAGPARALGPSSAVPDGVSGADGLDVLATALAELVADRGADELVDLDRLTRAAGLCLLYPWLADHCRAAQDAHPREDAATVRAVALAALVDPDDPALLDDVLVRHLAGLRSGDPAVAAPRVDLAGLRDAADRTLRSFAALLPGFEKSSAAFVRREWLARPGLLEDDRDPVALTAHTLPLDVLLGALPYPVGLFALPWCRPVTVRFRP